MQPDDHDFNTLLATAGDDLDAILESVRPEVDAYMARLPQIVQDDKPMKVRHARMGRLLQEAGLRYFAKAGRKAQRCA